MFVFSENRKTFLENIKNERFFQPRGISNKLLYLNCDGKEFNNAYFDTKDNIL